jgi:hypothetical protein
MTGISRSVVQRILERGRREVYIPRFLHGLDEDDPNRRAQVCEENQHKIHEDVEFVSKALWSDEATFKLTGTVNRHYCVYWAPE